jgi:hypothetical protein
LFRGLFSPPEQIHVAHDGYASGLRGFNHGVTHRNTGAFDNGFDGAPVGRGGGKLDATGQGGAVFGFVVPSQHFNAAAGEFGRYRNTGKA